MEVIPWCHQLGSLGGQTIEEQVVARFLIDHPIRPGMVRAILDTLLAQGGAYEPHLVRRSHDEGLRRITGARPARLLDEVGEAGSETTFLRVAETHPQPVLSFSVSPTPRSNPTSVALSVPASSLDSSKEIERLLGVCKGLYLFLEAMWGSAGIADPPGARRRAGDHDTEYIDWANFFGPDLLASIGPSRLLTSMAFIVEILPDGGVMLVSHPTPELARSVEGRALRRQLAEGLSAGPFVPVLKGRTPRGDHDPAGRPSG